MNIIVIIAILVLVCVGIDIVALILIMQVMLRLDDMALAEMIVLPSVQVKESPSTISALIDL
jgi:hypothetical protein